MKGRPRNKRSRWTGINHGKARAARKTTGGNAIGRRILEAIDRNKFSMMWLAAQLGISYETMLNWIRSTHATAVPAVAVWPLARILKCYPRWLATGHGSDFRLETDPAGAVELAKRLEDQDEEFDKVIKAASKARRALRAKADSLRQVPGGDPRGVAANPADDAARAVAEGESVPGEDPSPSEREGPATGPAVDPTPNTSGPRLVR